ncbi:MAG: hypothetical protein OXD45_02915 [Rhodobacteraceae bacterium]|nr:hypothetical protein [Paracoccaceae bacterium]
MTRLFTISGNDLLADGCEGGKQRQATSFNHALKVVAANLEELLLSHAKTVARTVKRMAGEMLRIRIRLRPGRSHPRVSRQPRSKWTRVARHPT